MRFTCPACQSQYRLPSQRLATGATARLTCPECHAPLLLEHVPGLEDLRVSAVAASPRATSDFFGDSGTRTPLPDTRYASPPPLPQQPIALPRKPTAPPRRELPARAPDYDKLLQEFSVLFRLHRQKKRKGLLGTVALAVVPLLAVAVALGIAADGRTREHWLAQVRVFLGDPAPQPPLVTASLTPVRSDPLPEVEPAADLPFPWADLPQLEQQLATVALLPVPHEVAPPPAVAPIAQAPQPPKPVVMAKADRPVLVAKAVPPVLVAKAAPHKPAVVAHRSPWPREAPHVAQPAATERFRMDDDLLDDTPAQVHRGAGPSVPPTPEP